MYNEGIDIEDIFNDDSDEAVFLFNYEIPNINSNITDKIKFDI